MPRAYVHRLDLSKVKVLRLIAEKHAAGAEWVKVQRDGALIKDPALEVQADDVHALRLSWFGLLERMGRRTGKYRITPEGWKFIRGEDLAPCWVRELGGRVIELSHERIGMGAAIGVVLDRAYWSEYAKGGAA